MRPQRPQIAQNENYPIHKKPKKQNYLILLNPLNGDSIPILLVGGNVGIPELTVTQQLSNRVAHAEILVVTKIRALPTWDDSALASRNGFFFGSQLMGIPLIRFALSLIARSVLFRCYDRRSRRGLWFVCISTVKIEGGGGGGVGIGVVAIRATDFRGRKTSTHDWKTEKYGTS